MKRIFTEALLKRENVAYGGSGGCSRESRKLGFTPAFLDFATQTIYPSCFADGRAAPFHLLDGLPDAVVVRRSSATTASATCSIVRSSPRPA